MPRTKRAIADNAVYHVLNRGHDGRVLLSDKKDFKAFKRLIKKYKRRFEFELYNYCLMPTHFHFLLKIIKGLELPLLMKGICQSYAFYFKKQYNLLGYLFQNRYKSLTVDKDEYLLECARYIERNPVRAGMVTNVEDYPWSSYNFYAAGKQDDIITANPLYLALSNNEEERRTMYIKYVTTPRPYESLLDAKLSELK